MARKDTGLFLEAGGEEMVLMKVIAGLMDGYIDRGLGGMDWTVMGRGIVK
jgi:hypothetical protein